MKRWIVVALAAVMVLSVTVAAFADDHVDGDGTEDAGELNDKQMARAEGLSSYFAPRLAADDAEPEDIETGIEDLTSQIVEFRTGDERVGWGAMYKLMLLAEYRGVDVGTVAEDLRSDGGWGFGKAFKEVRSDAEWAGSSDTPKNLGQWKKQQRKAGSSND